MPIERTLEPEPDAPVEEARTYHNMDHSVVNRQFVDDLLKGSVGPRVIDLGCGPAGIAIELCGRESDIEMIAVDAEVEMLEIAKMQIDFAGLLGRITLEHARVGEMDFFEDETADTVISNSLIHHLDNAEIGLRASVRLTKKGGRVFIRDLARPDSVQEVESLVDQYTEDESENAKQLFRQSLHAAFTIAEIREIARGLGIPNDDVQMTSDRHWTIDWTRVN